MAHFQLPAGWVSPVPAGHVPGLVEYELLWDQTYAAINGDDGGTWAPGAFITVGGSGLQLTGTAHELGGGAKLTLQNLAQISIEAGAAIRANGTGAADILLKVSAGGVASLDVSSGAVINVDSGGALDLYGAGTIKSGGNLTTASGGSTTVASGATANHNSGSTTNLNGAVNVYTALAKVQSGGQVSFLDGSDLVSEDGASAVWLGTFTFADDTWPLVAPARPWKRRDIEVTFCTFDGGSGEGPDLADAWTAPSATGNASCIRTAVATAGGARSVIGWKDLPPGATITSVTIETIGGNTSFATVPTYTIVRWQTGGDTLDLLSSAVPDPHVVGDWNTTNLTATITPTSTLVIDKTWRYGLKVTHPHALAGTYLRILDCAAIGTADHLQNT